MDGAWTPGRQQEASTKANLTICRESAAMVPRAREKRLVCDAMMRLQILGLSRGRGPRRWWRDAGANGVGRKALNRAGRQLRPPKSRDKRQTDRQTAGCVLGVALFWLVW